MNFSHIRLLVVTLGLALLGQAGMAADQETRAAQLQVSETLTMRKLDETERALLRLESRVGQTLIDDKALLDELLARLDRMAAIVADLSKLLAVMPASAPCKPVSAPACPTPPVAAAGGSPGDAAELPWLPIAGGAAALALIAALLMKRRKRRAEDELGDLSSPTPTSVPAASAKHPSPPAASKATAAPSPVGTAAQARAPTASPTASPAAPPPTATPAKPSAAHAEPVAFFTQPAEMQPDAKGANGEADMSLELADVMLSMGLTEGAAQTLSDHIRQHPRQALYHWLKLLDIYRKSGMKAEFDKATAEIQEHFNMAPPEWQERTEDAVAKVETIENYPHISSRVQELWPRRSCTEYLSRLLEDNRGGTRAGFPQPVVEEILLLLSMLKD